VFLKALLTFYKGVKIGTKNIEVNREFPSFVIDKTQLKNYKEYFSFKNDFPLTYLYLLAQRAQVSLMLNKEFTISIPGLIHLSNDIKWISNMDINKPISIKSSVFVESKKEGSLLPKFKVEFYQGINLVAKCESVYLAKRKSKSIKKKRKEVLQMPPPKNIINWSLTKTNALNYTKISRDKNPIHTSRLIAKLFGFRSTIIHGWYLVSKIASEIEKQKELESLTCQFYNAVELPNNVQFLMNGDQIKIVSDNEKIHVSCNIR